MSSSPYEPGPGSRPTVVVGRSRQLERARALLARVRGTGRPPSSALCFTGSRGTGKTVTLDLIRDRASELGFVVTGVSRFDRASSSPQRLATNIARAASDADLVTGARKDRWREWLGQLSVEFSAAGIVKIAGSLPPPAEDPSQRDSLTNLLVETAQAAVDSGRPGLAVFIDEFQEAGYPDPAMSDLVVIANSIQDSLRMNAPIVFIAAGLPDTPDRVMAAASFAERFDFNQLPLLSSEEAGLALLEPAGELGVHFDPAAEEYVVQAAGGSPFLIQLYGDELWQQCAPGKGHVFTLGQAREAIGTADENLAAGMFRGRWNKATEREQLVMLGIASVFDDGRGVTTAEVTTALGADSARAWSRVRQQLIDKGLIESVAHGRISFTMPGFARYVREHYASIPDVALDDEQNDQIGQ